MNNNPKLLGSPVWGNLLGLAPLLGLEPLELLLPFVSVEGFVGSVGSTVVFVLPSIFIYTVSAVIAAVLLISALWIFRLAS